MSDKPCGSLKRCDCKDHVGRREFLALTGVGATAAILSQAGASAMADEPEATDFERLVPADKKLDPAWVRSLFERGQPTVYRGDELKMIGMPVGGICTGQLYLGGDGKLWNWDVFRSTSNQPWGERVRGVHYAKPMQPQSPLEQGFALKVTSGGKTQLRELDRRGFAEIAFEGRYPIGYVDYRDHECPVTVRLEAFSPFIPLDPENSGLPATVMQYTVKNASKNDVEVELAGWMQNAVCPDDDRPELGAGRNRITFEDGVLTLACSAEPPDASDAAQKRLAGLVGYGTMALALLDAQKDDLAGASLAGEMSTAAVFDALKPGSNGASASQPLGQKIFGAVGRKRKLAAGEQTVITLVVSWYFPAYQRATADWAALANIAEQRRHYSGRFPSAPAVTAYLAKHFDRLARETRLWVETWYDSTLPYWFLDRTFLNTSTLATQTCHWFVGGRFYGSEGTYCCPGTCQHVWQYAQAIARLFPSLERTTREMVDYDIAYHDSGALDYRGEVEKRVAHDGQAGTIVRAYREHQMSADDAFLSRNWPKIKGSIEYLIREDGDDNGLLEGRQDNTLDAAWYGPMGWISSLYLAAVMAGREMAREMDDQAFADRCETIAARGRKNIVEQLFDGEYFIHRPDPKHPEATNTNDGCHIDQVFGQSHAMQLGLERVVPKAETLSALKSLWKYNYTPDIGPYRENFKAIKGGRWYAMPGEGGLLMCTWPKGGAEKAAGKGNPFHVAYFNECMSGYEYQVAAHMIAEGLVEEGLAVVRTIHDRYHASRRNPWNEVECSDHYARAMASYGAFVTACGYEHHGPKGHLAFAPQLTPENFRAAFTTAEGWGTFSQQRESGKQRETIEVKWGKLRLAEFAFMLADNTKPRSVRVKAGGKAIEARWEAQAGRVTIKLARELALEAGQSLEVVIA